MSGNKSTVTIQHEEPKGKAKEIGRSRQQNTTTSLHLPAPVRQLSLSCRKIEKNALGVFTVRIINDKQEWDPCLRVDERLNIVHTVAVVVWANYIIATKKRKNPPA